MSSAQTDRLVVGIDVGTSFSSIAYIDSDNQAVIIASEEGTGSKVPSTVLVEEGGETSVGLDACDLELAPADRVFISVKREFGKSEARQINGQPYSAAKVGALLLTKLRKDAEQRLGQEVVEAVITVPVDFTEPERESFKEAAELSGLQVRALVEEPIAACLAYTLQEGPDSRHLIFHLGGQTCDATVVRVESGQIRRVSTQGDRNLGGAQWDSALMVYLCQQFAQKHGKDPAADPIAMAEIRRRAIAAKATLSHRSKARVVINYNGNSLATEVTRDKLEELTTSLVTKVESLIHSVLEAAHESSDLSTMDSIILVGGSTRMPMIKAMIQRLSGKSARCEINPEEAVALGAARASRLEVFCVNVSNANSDKGSTESTAQAQSSHKDVSTEPIDTSGSPFTLDATVETPAAGTAALTDATMRSVTAPDSAHQRAPENRDDATQNWKKTRETLRGIQPQCWSKDPQNSVWKLSPEFTEHCFPGGIYRQVLCNSDPREGNLNIVICETSKGDLQVLLQSRRVPGEYYDFSFKRGEQKKDITRQSEHGPAGTATVMFVPPNGLTLFSPDIQETIQFDIYTLSSYSSTDLELQIAPWRRLLAWFGRLQILDPDAFKRVPGALKNILSRPDFEMAVMRIPPEQINQWIQAGILPSEFADIAQEHVGGLTASISSQQQMARQSQSGAKHQGGGWLSSLTSFSDALDQAFAGKAPAPVIPGVLLGVDTTKADLLDLKALVAMGALREVGGIFDREFKKLLERRPDLKMRLNAPEGQSLIMQDPEVQMLYQRPDVQQELREKSLAASGWGQVIKSQESQSRAMYMYQLTGLAIDPGEEFFNAKKKVQWKIYKPL